MDDQEMFAPFAGYGREIAPIYEMVVQGDGCMRDQDIFEAFDYYEEDVVGKDFLFEMSNLRQEETGLPMIIWADVNRGGKHNKPRIKISTSRATNVSEGELIPVLLSEAPRILTKSKQGKISSEDLREVGRFIALNKDALMKYWNGEISSKVFTNSVKSI